MNARFLYDVLILFLNGLCIGNLYLIEKNHDRHLKYLYGIIVVLGHRLSQCDTEEELREGARQLSEQFEEKFSAL